MPASLPYHSHSQLNNLVSSAWNLIDQTPPPSLRDILGAYRSRGDGDRDMLIAMLNAKTAEDQRLASVATLHRTILELYQTSPADAGRHLYPESNPWPAQPQLQDQKLSRRSPPPLNHHSHHHHRRASSSRSPPRATLPPMRDVPPSSSSSSLPPRKRHRPSHSPSSASRASAYDSQEKLPPSPYSSSGSDSVEYSPRSRASMAIGSLLSSSGPHRENGDIRTSNDTNANTMSNGYHGGGSRISSQPQPVAV